MKENVRVDDGVCLMLRAIGKYDRVRFEARDFNTLFHNDFVFLNEVGYAYIPPYNQDVSQVSTYEVNQWNVQ